MKEEQEEEEGEGEAKEEKEEEEERGGEGEAGGPAVSLLCMLDCTRKGGWGEMRSGT